MSGKRYLAIISAGLLLTACATTTPSRKPGAASWPSAVEATRNEYAQDCKPDAPKFGPDLIQSADLNHDGASDYVVSAFAYTCRDYQPYCGSAGCEVQVFLSGPQGLMEQRFNGYLQDAPHIAGGALVSGKGKWRLVFDPRSAEFRKAN